LYEKAGEMGVMVAQYNAALLLDDPTHEAELEENLGNVHARAEMWFKRAALQGNVDALIRMGDREYYHKKNAEGAVQYYRKAADLNAPQALFNLGVMHQFGDGLPQDVHLAKRYYDLAGANPEARIPVAIARWSLGIVPGKWSSVLSRLPWFSFLSSSSSSSSSTSAVSSSSAASAASSTSTTTAATETSTFSLPSMPSLSLPQLALFDWLLLALSFVLGGLLVYRINLHT
jgi:tetratricopeptide (TPR) repeat protein